MQFSYISRHVPELVVLAIVITLQAIGVYTLLRRRSSAPIRGRILAATGVSWLFLSTGCLMEFARVARLFPPDFGTVYRGVALLWAVTSAAWVIEFAVVAGISRLAHSPAHVPSPERRNFLRAGSAALLAAPVAVLGYGTFIERCNFGLREETVSLPGLPKDLEGLRLAQLTDIHLSAFLSEAQLARAVGMLNETDPHIAFVTGDLITSLGDPLDACLRQIARLRAKAGVFGCMGNHEAYAGVEDYVEEQAARAGVRFLRSATQTLVFGDSALNLAGVDYQPFHRGTYLLGAEEMIVPNAFNLLLSHNPDVFPVAARQGYALTLGGHTHGGQVNIEILKRGLNVARFYTPYVDGLYDLGGSAIFVSRGLGTIGLPTRLGAPPEVTLLTLRRA